MLNVLRAVLLLLSLALLAPSTWAEDKSAETKKLVVMLDWFVNPDHAALVVAQEMGLFAAQGLEVELQTPADPNDPPKLAAAGKVDVAVTYQPQLIIQVTNGLPVKRIGTLVATPLNSLVVLKNGPVKTLTDLKGRKIGYSVGGFEEALLKAMLAKVGLKAEDVTLVNVNFALSPSLLSKQVDAVIGAFRNFELNQMDLAKQPGLAFYPEEEGIPPYEELVLVANRDKLDDPRLGRFLTALEQATLYLVNHPDEAWKAFIAKHKDLDDELNRRAWRDTLPRLARRPAALDEGRYKRFANFLFKQGVITVALPVSNYAVQLPMPE
ncbi:MAG: transporter periplasmic component [Proteobacteria bacterium]|jgi:putative hydroxymethylpyrimidine transport system substrate-binding protein|nr:transporter periplasmic component [Pseudomonadota bacterium]MBS1224116.1 transporter periplasmic component [Pseudomonadota bacterium]MBS1248024.1 transporter periplasmic component [Pseudomonadota bacterium]